MGPICELHAAIKSAGLGRISFDWLLVGEDPVIGLVKRVRDARERYCDDSAVPDDESDAFADNVLTPAEDALTAAKPMTQEGVAAILDLALEALEQDASHLYWPLFETARDAMKAGVA